MNKRNKILLEHEKIMEDFEKALKARGRAKTRFINTEYIWFEIGWKARAKHD